MRILLVEDDAIFGDAIQAGLRQRDCSVDWVRDGQAATHALAAETYAAVILDLGLPRRSGLEILATLRARRDPVPVLILTARDTVADRIGGLDAGADDYLVKPVDIGELAARLRALVRRAAGQPAGVLTVGALALNPATREVAWHGEPRTLSAREFDLLHAFMLHAGQVLSRAQLEEKLYAWGEEVGSNAVDVHLHHLRRKIAPGIVRTIRGVGYVMPKDLQ
ncbi:MAG: response regulator [Gammaproteobacteria bacterium]